MEFGLPIELCQIILCFRTQLICKNIRKKKQKIVGWQQVHHELLNEHEIFCDTDTIVPVRCNFQHNGIWSRKTDIDLSYNEIEKAPLELMSYKPHSHADHFVMEWDPYYFITDNHGNPLVTLRKH